MLVDENNEAQTLAVDQELIFDVTTEEFEQKVMIASQKTPILVDFWAPWCGPCKQLMPLLEEEIKSLGGQVLLAKVNIDENQEWWIVVPELEEMEITSTVQLKDGTRHEGIITAYKEGESVQLTLESGSALTFPESEIEGITYTLPEETEKSGQRIVREREPVFPTRPKAKPVYEFRETGWFHNTSFAFSFGRREREDVLIFTPSFEERTVEMSAIGFNVQHIAGYHFSRKVGLGVGASYDAYDLEDGESMLTLFGHYRGYLSKGIVAPFISMNVGYGFALKNGNQGVKETDGGLMFHPEIGLRLGATDKANFTLGIGYRIQDAYYVQERPFNGNIEYRDVRYQRLLFSLGLVF